MAKDIEKAMEAVKRAERMLNRVSLLPPQVGGRIQWPHNGCLWERFGEDDWRSVDDSGKPNTFEGYPSSHVAGFDWELREQHYVV
jgi:hypothetical protein